MNEVMSQILADLKAIKEINRRRQGGAPSAVATVGSTVGGAAGRATPPTIAQPSNTPVTPAPPPTTTAQPSPAATQMGNLPLQRTLPFQAQQMWALGQKQSTLDERGLNEMKQRLMSNLAKLKGKELQAIADAVVEKPLREAPQPTAEEVAFNQGSATAGATTPLMGWKGRPLYTEYGEKASTEYGQEPTHVFSPGIDIAADEGESIESFTDGTVVFAGSKRTLGKMIMVEADDGNLIVYQSLNSIGVKPGQRVKRGQGIGEVGSKPCWGTENRNTAVPHLHLQVRDPVTNKPIDPMTYLQQVR